MKDQKGRESPIIGLDTKGGGNALDISTLRSEVANEQLEEDVLTELLRDRGATEDLLQNFILE